MKNPEDTSPLSMEDTAMDFNEWKSAGFFIRKGSKSRLRDAIGVPQFCLDQVWSPSDSRMKELRRDALRLPDGEFEIYFKCTKEEAIRKQNNKTND